jgi:hypothetical protein
MTVKRAIFGALIFVGMVIWWSSCPADMVLCAGLWIANLRVEWDPNPPYTSIRNQQDGPSLPPVIHRGLIASIDQEPLVYRYARITVSDIGGYRKLLETAGNSRTIYICSILSTPFPTDVTRRLEEFATDAGAMDGVTNLCGGTVYFRGWWSKSGTILDPDSVKMLTKVYHRTALGSETLLSQHSQVLTTTELEYHLSANFLQSFSRDERLVLKFSARFQKDIT